MANDTVVRSRTAAKKTTAKKAAPAAKKAAAKKATPAAKKTAATRAVKARAAAPAAPPAPPGWYEVDAEQSRYWDGREWLGAALPHQLVPQSTPSPSSPPALRAQPAPKATTDEITFRGRTMQIIRPTPDQLAVWQRIAERAVVIAQEAVKGPQPCPSCQATGKVDGGARDCPECKGSGDARKGQILKLYHRAMAIINAMLTEPDRDWLEDMMIDGTVDLQAAGEIVTLAIDALTAAAKGKAAAPTTGPKAKLRR